MKPIARKISALIIEGSIESMNTARDLFLSQTTEDALRIMLDVAYGADRIVDDAEMCSFADFMQPIVGELPAAGEATHYLRTDPGRRVRVIIWTLGGKTELGNEGLFVYKGNVYFTTIQGTKTREEEQHGVHMLGGISVDTFNNMLVPIDGMEKYHEQIITAIKEIDRV